MRSPFDNMEGAFEPFFAEKVSVTTKDGETAMLNAAVFTCGQSDPIQDADMLDTEREDITFLFRSSDWPFVQKLTRGAKARVVSTCEEYAVMDARLDAHMGCCVTARGK